MEIHESLQRESTDQEGRALDMGAELKDEQRLLSAFEWPLQAGWFEYRVNLLSDSEIESLVQKVIDRDPSETRRQYIINGSLDTKKDAIISDSVDPEGSIAGSIERRWFRAEAQKQPLDVRFKEALKLIERDELTQAFETLNSYFFESTKKH